MRPLGIALVVVALVGAVVAVVAGDSTAGTAVSIALIGCAAVGAVSLAFLAVGRAEDREREEAAARPQAQPGSPAPEDPHPPRTLGLGPDRQSRRPPRRPQ